MFKLKNYTSIIINFIKLCPKSTRNFSFYNKMDSVVVSSSSPSSLSSLLLTPPIECRGMKILDKRKFQKKIKIPQLNVTKVKNLNSLMIHIKKYLLKMLHLKPIRIDEIKKEKFLLLNPLIIKTWQDLPQEVRHYQQHDECVNDDKNLIVVINENDLIWIDIILTYDNWQADELLKSILPSEHDSVASYSRIGHIVHINLREHFTDYKQIIGMILLDKISGCRTVVNKINIIENTYRNFEMELLSGVPEYVVQVKENLCKFEFDFSRVYWNPRLATEHQRIVNIISTPHDICYDCFAGIGPFAIPIAKRKSFVMANDLNPESYRWLEHNRQINKINSNSMKLFNKDGNDFIREDIKKDLLNRWQRSDGVDTCDHPELYNIHILMNLPAIAVDFLDSFKGLFSDNLQLNKDNLIYPIVHLYCFARGMEKTDEIAKQLVEDKLGIRLTDEMLTLVNTNNHTIRRTIKTVNFVRNVAPNKDMFRISFRLTKEILFANDDTTTRSPSEKRPLSSSFDNSLTTNITVKKQCN